MTDRTLPQGPLGGEAQHLVSFLRFYRATVVEKCGSLPNLDQDRSRLPSGWSPLGLLLHLAAMERRWLLWRFLGEDVSDPFLDSLGVPDGSWQVPVVLTVDMVDGLMRRTATRTDAVLTTTPLETVGVRGGSPDEDPPTLRWVGFHLLQEYARHAGQLDVAVEIAGGPVGE